MSEKVIVEPNDVVGMLRMGWHYFKCIGCNGFFMSKAHNPYCPNCIPKKETFIDFIKLLFRRK